MTGHQMAGRIAAANVPNIVTFCRCGLGFWGHDAGEADQRWSEHVRECDESHTDYSPLPSS